MSGKKSYLNRFLNLLWGYSSQEALHSRKRSLQMESLEVREMLSADGLHPSLDLQDSDDSALIQPNQEETNSNSAALFGIESASENTNPPSKIYIGEIKHAIEGNEHGYVRVDRNNAQTELTFNYIFDSAGSTAIMGDDFAQLPGIKSGSTFGTFTFMVGESSVYIPITVFDDNLIETDKTVRIVLTTGNGNYELDENFEAIVTIKDNDRPANIRIETIQHGIEGEQDALIRLHRDQTDNPLTVPLNMTRMQAPLF
jgi:hypothetical protein